MIFYKKLTVALMLSFGILINPALANSEKNQAVASTQSQTVQAQEKPILVQYLLAYRM